MEKVRPNLHDMLQLSLDYIHKVFHGYETASTLFLQQ